jgi:hypothetical protein
MVVMISDEWFHPLLAVSISRCRQVNPDLLGVEYAARIW